MKHAKTLGRDAGTVGRRFRFRAGRARRPSSPTVPQDRYPARQGQAPTANWPSPKRWPAARRRWCWPAPSAARAPTMPSCMWRWRSGAPRKACRSSSPAATQEALPAAARLARLRFRRRHAVQHPRLLASVRGLRDGREMAARQRRGAVRLVADALQRSARRPQDLACASAAPCCLPIPIRATDF